jgi:hypothetical protein
MRIIFFSNFFLSTREGKVETQGYGHFGGEGEREEGRGLQESYDKGRGEGGGGRGGGTAVLISWVLANDEGGNSRTFRCCFVVRGHKR